MKTETSNTFLRNNGIYFIGSLLMGGLNYIYYPLLGRLMPVTAFGEVQVLFSVLAEVSILYAALGLELVHVTVNKKHDEAVSMLEEVEKLGVLIFMPLLAVWLASIPAAVRFLHFDDHLALMVFFLAVVVAFFVGTRQAVIQGKESFLHLTINGVGGAAIKLAASVIFVQLGWGVAGAILGLLVGQLIMLVYAMIVGRRLGFPINLRLRIKVNWPVLLAEWRNVVPIFVVSLVVTSLFSSDVIIIKHLFSPEVAGHYAGVAAIGRIIIFLTLPFSAVLFTRIKPTASRRSNRATLRLSLAILGLSGGVATLLMVVAPHFLTLLLLGSRYGEQAAVLPWLALALFCLSVFNLVAYYDLALRRKSIMYITLLGVLIAAILVAFRHATALQVVVDMLLTSVIMVVIRLAVTLAGRAGRIS